MAKVKQNFQMSVPFNKGIQNILRTQFKYLGEVILAGTASQNEENGLIYYELTNINLVCGGKSFPATELFEAMGLDLRTIEAINKPVMANLENKFQPKLETAI